MKINIPAKLQSVTAILIFAFFNTVPYNGSVGRFAAYAVSPRVVYSADAQGDRSPYGGTGSGSYGEKKEIVTKEEAEKVFKEYFAKKNVKIGEVKEKELYFEAVIRDKNDTVIDKVIVDKRTGRIRSIY